MSALNRLRALEISREAGRPEPSKPTKAPFDGFVGAPLPSSCKYSQAMPVTAPAFRNQYAPAHEHEHRTANNSVDRWRVHYSTGAAMEVLFTPPATADEVAVVYPGARIQPMQEAQEAPSVSPAPDVARRRSRALAILAEHPNQRIGVIAEASSPAHVTVAVRDLAVGDLEIPAERFDAFQLLALMQTYGTA